MSMNSRAQKKRRAEKRARLVKSDRLSDKVERALDLPQGSLSGAVRIELTGNRRAVIDGSCGIVEYNGDIIRLSTDSGIIRFTGSNLMMSCLTDDNAVVEGVILSIEYL